MDTKKLENILKITFKDKEKLKAAFVHRSYLNEHPEFDLPANERLEFLGDAILQFLTSEYLYKKYKKESEGNLTSYRAALVNTASLSETALSIKLGKFLYLSRGEEDTGGSEREYILANTFEALLGAIFLDKGITVCREFLKTHLFGKISIIIENKQYKDFKSVFQEKAQEKYFETPSYKLLKQWGPDHDKRFIMGVLVNKKIQGKGVGRSKQRAEQKAAKDALSKLSHKNNGSKN